MATVADCKAKCRLSCRSVIIIVPMIMITMMTRCGHYSYNVNQTSPYHRHCYLSYACSDPQPAPGTWVSGPKVRRSEECDVVIINYEISYPSFIPHTDDVYRRLIADHFTTYFRFVRSTASWRRRPVPARPPTTTPPTPPESTPSSLEKKGEEEETDTAADKTLFMGPV